jgi:tRNA (guanine37-N1)-methyltransferase
MKKIQVITLFPEMLSGVFGSSMMWKAQKESAAEFTTIDLRQFGLGPRRQVDDTPYGGGDGMLLKPEPLFAAVEQAKVADPTARVFLMTPRGRRLKQALAQEWADDERGMIFICGRYEGYDERIVSLVDEQVSVGDYVLTGGELPAMTIIDAVVRLLPGVLGGEQSAAIESFSDGETLEFPQYTRPITPQLLPGGPSIRIKLSNGAEILKIPRSAGVFSLWWVIVERSVTTYFWS